MAGRGPQYLLSGVAGALYPATNFEAGPGGVVSVARLLGVDRPLRINTWALFASILPLACASLYVLQEGFDPTVTPVPTAGRVAGWNNGDLVYGAGAVAGLGVRVLPNQGLLGTFSTDNLDPTSIMEMTVTFDLED